ncbi:MAG: hypothetical protein AB7G28_24260, partial [Pirellulales bacterium]
MHFEIATFHSAIEKHRATKNPAVRRLSLTPGLSFQFGKLFGRFASLERTFNCQPRLPTIP